MGKASAARILNERNAALIRATNETKKHILMMVVGCGLALLLIFLLPAMGLGIGWVLAIAFGAMMLCHLMHFGMQNHDRKGDNGHEH